MPVVVLIFLLVTTTFKKPQNSLQLALPRIHPGQKSGANENPPLVVSIEAAPHTASGPEATPVTMDQLSSELLAASSTNALVKLTVSEESKSAPWGQIVKVMDAAKEAEHQKHQRLHQTRQLDRENRNCLPRIAS